MKTSVIRQRVADFLKRYAPFDALSEPDLLELAGSGRVKFHESEEYIFHQGEGKGQFVWIIEQGRVELLEESASGERLRDVLGEGDLLGLERFAGDGSCLYSARTATDVILYGVAAALVESLVPRYPMVKRFVRAHFSVAGVLGFGRISWLDAEAPPLEFLRARMMTMPLNSSITEAAYRLTLARNNAAALVDESGAPAGVITPIDLCAARRGPARLTARAFPPALAAPVTTRSAVREMLQAGAAELAITRDGTRDCALEAILTATDLALFCGHDPVRLVSAIRRAGAAAEIIPLLHQAKKLVLDALAQPHDVDDCCRIGAELVAALADACIRLGQNGVLASGIASPGTSCCWMMFGAAARGDLWEPGLPAIAAVYDDSAEDFQAEDSVYFAALVGEAAEWFHTCGLSGPSWLWPTGSQPSMPLSEWRRFYDETIRDPIGHDLYARREFFDLWSLAGDRSVLQQVQEHILAGLRDQAMVIRLLAHDTLAHLPSFTFFRGLVLNLDGGQQDSFDIASAAIAPIADAARVFTMAKQRLAPANTLERLQAAIADFPAGRPILRDAAEAFRIALYYQTLAGSSRIEPGKLGRFDQRLLKTVFSSIQRLLEFTASTFLSST